MNDHELERLLTDSLDARARGAIGDDRRPPAFEDRPTGHTSARSRRRTALLAPLATAAAVALVAGGIALFHPSSPDHPASTAGAVHVRLKFGDGAQVGVGMPVIAYFSRAITSAKSLAAATSVTVNGKPAHGAWYFERSAADPGYPIEGHLRLERFWPAHANIVVRMPIRGLSAGTGLAYDESLSVAFATGAATVATVSAARHQMLVTTDGRTVGTYPVSLGGPATPTERGTKVIMEKRPDIALRGPGFDQPNVRYTQRLSYGGEYLLAAPWNTANIGRSNSSNGSTDLRTSDARQLYRLFEVGDVVRYPDATGPSMQLGQGYGDWNVPWAQWLTGGLIPTG
ncbi:MAG: L,D-transpeptidase [Jatrophihabitantaceae bacterium]